MKIFMGSQVSKQCRLCIRAASGSCGSDLSSRFQAARFHAIALICLATTAALAIGPALARSQSLVPSENSSAAITTTSTAIPGLQYERPTQRTMVTNYVFAAFGPYPVAGAAFAAGIGQFTNSPPEWRQGVAGYSRRFGSEFGIAAVGTTTRYGLSQALREDSLYYRCDCRGVIPRFSHAVLSTFTARHGMDGHRVFSFPALVAPYAGSFTAVYGWYPDRFGAKDAFRIGNYNLLAYAGGNVALEFLYSGPHSLLSRMHLNNAHGSSVQGPNQ